MGCGARLGVAKAMVVEPLLSSTERPHAGRWITFSRLRLMFADPLSSAESVARANQTHALIFLGFRCPDLRPRLSLVSLTTCTTPFVLDPSDCTRGHCFDFSRSLASYSPFSAQFDRIHSRVCGQTGFILTSCMTLTFIAVVSCVHSPCGVERFDEHI